MRVFSTFSGISAASVAWKPLGYDFVGFCEPEPLPCHVLNARCGATAPVYLPEGKRRANYKHIAGGTVPNWGDITQITDDDLRSMGRVDVLEGGSPCQDFSIAGLRKGLDGDRGNLTLAFVRLALRMREINGLKYVVWENVYGVLSDRTNAFGKLLSALVGGPERGLVASGRGWTGGWTGAGHVAGPQGEAAWRVMDAQAWGVPQRRRRVFLVANFGDRSVCCGDVLSDPQGEGRGVEACGEPREDAAGSAGRSAEAVAWNARQDDFSPKTFSPPLDTDGSTVAVLHPAIAMQHAVAHGFDPYNNALSREVMSTLGVNCGMSTGRNLALHEAPHGSPPCADRGAAIIAHPAVTGTLCASGAGLTRAAGQANETDLCTMQKSVSDHGWKWVVRRLTPLECERLQGFPDLWTEVGYKGKNAPPDGPRYKALGNSMAVPCMAHIGQRLIEEEAYHASKAAGGLEHSAGGPTLVGGNANEEGRR